MTNDKRSWVPNAGTLEEALARRGSQTTKARAGRHRGGVVRGGEVTQNQAHVPSPPPPHSLTHTRTFGVRCMKAREQVVRVGVKVGVKVGAGVHSELQRGPHLVHGFHGDVTLAEAAHAARTHALGKQRQVVTLAVRTARAHVVRLLSEGLLAVCAHKAVHVEDGAQG
jgi:hypothetical protein